MCFFFCFIFDKKSKMAAHPCAAETLGQNGVSITSTISEERCSGPKPRGSELDNGAHFFLTIYKEMSYERRRQ